MQSARPSALGRMKILKTIKSKFSHESSIRKTSGFEQICFLKWLRFTNFYFFSHKETKLRETKLRD